MLDRHQLGNTVARAKIISEIHVPHLHAVCRTTKLTRSDRNTNRNVPWTLISRNRLQNHNRIICISYHSYLLSQNQKLSRYLLADHTQLKYLVQKIRCVFGNTCCDPNALIIKHFLWHSINCVDNIVDLSWKHGLLIEFWEISRIMLTDKLKSIHAGQKSSFFLFAVLSQVPTYFDEKI